MSADHQWAAPASSAILPVPRPGLRITVVVAAAIVAMVVTSVAANPRFRWDIVARCLFSAEILEGLRITLELTVCGMAIGTAGGLVLALMRLSRSRFLVTVIIVYVWFFRGTPVLVQLLFWFNIEALYPNFGMPFGTASGLDLNTLVTPIVAAIFGLGLNEAAYMAEITRAGIASVDAGQVQAAKALGMTRSEALRRIVLPQAMRILVPPMANEAIGLLKTSSIASVIAVTDLLYSAQLIYSVNYMTMPLLIVASLWYLAVTSVLSLGQHYLERRFSHGVMRHAHGA